MKRTSSPLVISVLYNVPNNNGKTNTAVSPASTALATTKGAYRPPASFVSTSREPFKETHTSVYTSANISTMKCSIGMVSHLVSSWWQFFHGECSTRSYDHRGAVRGTVGYISAASHPDNHLRQHGLRLSGFLDARVNCFSSTGVSYPSPRTQDLEARGEG